MTYLCLGDRGPVRVVNAELSTVTTEADKVLRGDEREPWLVHIELQVAQDRRLESRLLRYHALLGYRHELPTWSVAVLLRPEADRPEFTGELRLRMPDGRESTAFRYDVVRAWRVPVESVLSGGLGTLPLAPLSDVSPDSRPEVLRRVGERLRDEATPEEAMRLWATSGILMGLRYPGDVIDAMLRRMGEMIFNIRGIEESSTYRAILEQGRAGGLSEGRAEEGRRMPLSLGERWFGPPSGEVRAAIEALGDLERIERLAVTVLDAEGREELLASA